MTEKILYSYVIIGLISFLMDRPDDDNYDHEDASNRNEARGVKKERQVEFKPQSN